MNHVSEGGTITGTKDKHYDLIWFTEQCLSNALQMETFRADAEEGGDAELAELFGKAQHDSAKGAEIAKSMLARRLGQS